jgi:hypothetical protein
MSNSPHFGDPQINFIVAGAQKCGTSALRHFLSQHPEIGMPHNHIEEPHFFDHGIKKTSSGDYSAYHDLYTPDALSKVTGDVTPIYFYYADALKYAHTYNPKMKVIILLRDPIKRAHSQWAMQREMGIETVGFLLAIIKEFLVYLKYGQHPNYSYIQRGFYAKQLKRMYRYFPKDQCLILATRDLKENHIQTLEKIYNFLGVSSVSPPEPEIIHSRSYTEPKWIISTVLRIVYSKEMSKVEKMLGWRPKP